MRAAENRYTRWPLVILICLLPATIGVDRIGEGSLELKSVTYKPFISRDPFDIPDFDEEHIARPTDELDLLDAVLVGIVRGQGLRFAVVEDEAGESFTLVEGDPVYKGRITKIGDEFLIAAVYANGVRQSVRLDLVKEGD